MVPSADRRGSKNKRWPSAIFPAVWGLSGGIAARVAAAGRPGCRIDLGWASALAAAPSTSPALTAVDASSAISTTAHAAHPRCARQTMLQTPSLRAGRKLRIPNRDRRRPLRTLGRLADRPGYWTLVALQPGF